MTDTFLLPLDLLLLVNSRYLEHVERIDADKVKRYAAMPAETQPPIRVRKNSGITDGFHRLAASRLRNDSDVLCCPATVQEELSAFAN